MSERSFHDAHAGSRFTFAEVSTDQQLEWIADNLRRLRDDAMELQHKTGATTNLDEDIEMMALLIRQVRCRVVAEGRALHDRLSEHGDSVTIQLGHDLTAYFEPDGPAAKTREGDSHA